MSWLRPACLRTPGVGGDDGGERWPAMALVGDGVSGGLVKWRPRKLREVGGGEAVANTE